MTDNYEAVRRTWRQRFVEMDHNRIAEKFGLRMDEEHLYMRYFHRLYAISRRDGRIIRVDQPETGVSFGLEMNFFNMFHYAKDAPRPSRELVPFRQVKRAYPFEAAYNQTIVTPFAEQFAGHVPELQGALDALGIRRLPQGDASGVLEVIPGLEIAVLFWDGDEEFPAQANLLFDSNITDFMHEENVVMVASNAVRLLVEASGLGDSKTLL